jgi:CubicO group peptidase (beta-lactamase class C family)
MGGVAGHAGLFGTVHGVLAVARAWLEESPLSLPGSVRGRFWSLSRIPGHHRRLGWDAPTTGGSTGGALTDAAAGHLGYTGTSLWIEPDRGRVYVLLSNRVHPTRAREPEIRALRQAFHRAAARL